MATELKVELGLSKDEQLVIEFRRWMVDAEAAHKAWRETFKLEELDKYWEGQQTPPWWNEDFFIPINLMFSTIQRQLDNMTSVTPYFNVRPDRTYNPVPDLYPQFDQQAKIRENLLNFTVRQKSLKREVRKATLDAYLAMGVVKVYYTPVIGPHPQAGQVVPGLQAQYPSIKLFKETFHVSRRNPMDIRLDPFADSLENIKKVAERMEFTLDEVKNNPLFKNTDNLKSLQTRAEEKISDEQRKRGSTSYVASTGGNSSLAGFSLGKKEDIVVVWEVYDIENERIQAFAEGHELALRDDPMPDSIDDHSYIFLTFVDRRNSPYPVPGAYHQLGTQDEYNITRNQTMLHRRRFNRKYQTRRSAVKEDELAKLESPVDGAIILTEADGEVIRTIQDAPLDQAVYFDTVQLRRDYQDVSGDPVADSELAKIEKAGVANLVAASQQGRVRGLRSTFMDFYETLAQKLMRLYEVELSLPLAVAVVGQDGVAWTQISSRSLRRGTTEFRYEVAADSLVPQTPENERAGWLALMQFVSLNPTFGLDPILVEKTARAFGVFDKQVIASIVQASQAALQQQMLVGGSAGKPATNTARSLGVPS